MLTEIVIHAMVYTLTDIGQLTPEQKRELKAAVKKGYLSKGKGGPFPRMKTVYAHPDFDFVADREQHIEHAMYLSGLDMQRLSNNLAAPACIAQEAEQDISEFENVGKQG